MEIKVMAVPADVAKQLREIDDAGRTTQGYVDAEGGAPLRCCLKRSVAGERIALVSYAPLRRWEGVDAGAYVELGPVFIHGDECDGPDGVNELQSAPRVVRAYDGRGRIRGGTLTEDVTAAAREWLGDRETALVHVRAVEYGCFMFEVRRASH